MTKVYLLSATKSKVPYDIGIFSHYTTAMNAVASVESWVYSNGNRDIWTAAKGDIVWWIVEFTLDEIDTTLIRMLEHD